MTYSSQLGGIAGKVICFGCIGEEQLSNDVEAEGGTGQCSYCGTVRACITLDDLADRVQAAFEDHYVRAPDEPDSWGDGYPVVEAIEEAAQVPGDAAQDVQALLEDRHASHDKDKVGEETEFASGSCYAEKGASIQAWQAEWRDFSRSLRTEARFFNQQAAVHLRSIFAGIDKLPTRDGRPVLLEAGPGLALTDLYRARVFQSTDRLLEALQRPDKELGPPPAHAATAGRMNARGIPVFYGATQPRTAIAEVRPPVGSSVAIARFDIVRPLRLLDLTAIDQVVDGGSIFDRSLAGRLERAAFLRTLGDLLTRPVMPGEEDLDYLSTQAIADFLASGNDPVIDGIVFRSVQVKDGRNVVLFQKASRVEALDLPPGTELTSSGGQESADGFEVDFTVWEEVPPGSGEPEPAVEDRPWRAFARRVDVDADVREASLRVDAKAVRVHRVDFVDYSCTIHDVSRHRFEKKAWKFEAGAAGIGSLADDLSDRL